MTRARVAAKTVASFALLACGVTMACARPTYYLQAPLERPTADAGVATARTRDAGARSGEGASTARGLAALTGRWGGTGTQSDGQKWQIFVTFRPTLQGLCATAEYPGVGCTADWTCRGMEEGHLVASERITRGKDKCIDGGEMRMEWVEGDLLEWSWRKDGETAEALLRRAP
ncbi:MAG: hypothetical protein U0174_17680 [Polyangiaceae bacterium]